MKANSSGPEEIKRLRKQLRERNNELNRLYRERANLADAERVIDWIRNGTQQAVFAFTSGPERSICYVIESLWKLPGESHLDVPPPAEAARTRRRQVRGA